MKVGMLGYAAGLWAPQTENQKDYSAQRVQPLPAKPTLIWPDYAPRSLRRLEPARQQRPNASGELSIVWKRHEQPPYIPADCRQCSIRELTVCSAMAVDQ